jgi:hypothetical protein
VAVVVKHKTITPQRQKFKEAVAICKEKVKNLPKGQKRAHYIECMREHLRK